MTRLFVGGLTDAISCRELENEFSPFGYIEDCFVAKNPPGFGFVVFQKYNDAEYAIKQMNGRYIYGSRLRVEYARGRGGGRIDGKRGGYFTDIKCYSCGGFGHTSRQCKSNNSNVSVSGSISNQGSCR